MNNLKHRVTDKRGRAPEKIVLPDRPPEDVIPEAPDYDKINAQMCGDRFLFQNFPMSSKIGSIHIPQIGDVGINKARVVGVGPECKKLKVGMIVYKVAELGEYLVTSEGTFRFLPENAAIAIDKEFDGKATPVMKYDQAGA